jgi:Ran GTPase-activating protein (RanGAP) involved in mRNA processing and transport
MPKIVTLRCAADIVKIVTNKKKVVVDVNLGGTLDKNEAQIEELLAGRSFPAKIRDLDLTDIGSTALPQDPEKQKPPQIVKNTLRLMPMLKKCKTLRALSLGNNWFGVEGCVHLSKVIQKNSSLTKLDLAFNCIRDEGLVLLMEGLKKSQCCLHHLDLSHNSIGDNGMEALATSIENGAACDLTKLSLKYNNIGSAGCRHLKGAFEHPHSCPLLRSLKLGSNQIGDTGAAVLATALAEGALPQLTCLDLANNSITHSGSFKLAECVKATAVRGNLKMNLCSNKLTVSTIKSMERSHSDGLVPRPNLSLSTQVLRMTKAQAIFQYHHKKYTVTKNGFELKADPRDRPGHKGKVLFKQWEDGMIDFDHNTTDADISAVLAHLGVRPARMFKAYRLAQLHRALSDYPGLGKAENRELLMADHNETRRLQGCHQLKDVVWNSKGRDLKNVARVYGTNKGQRKVVWGDVTGEGGNC